MSSPVLGSGVVVWYPRKKRAPKGELDARRFEGAAKVSRGGWFPKLKVTRKVVIYPSLEKVNITQAYPSSNPCAKCNILKFFDEI
jgi:hypothetical protein